MTGTCLKLALTGAIGSGKSEVAQLFRALGARVIDADDAARRLLEPNQPGWLALRDEFADLFFNPDRTLDRKKLREAIFADRALREKVDSLLHPLIRAALAAICSCEAANGKGSSARNDVPLLTVVEVPLLYEVGWQADFDLVIVVAADREICLERVMRRDGVDREAALAAFGAQMDPDEKVAMADYVIDNSGDIEATARQVRKIHADLAG
ncbi:MAG: dephospho-CoA kinase [Desulfurivibrionaceae bacterium]|nr:dephospho-CoA kinase [Desulfobulbales bacterium]MDT8334928.1 dephospho-CoA kinase [Desulfurivibrionaceae bacterium]